MVLGRYHFLGALLVGISLTAGCGGGGASVGPVNPDTSTYTAVKIGPLPANFMVASINGLNNSGAVVGTIYNVNNNVDGAIYPFSWKPGQSAKQLSLPSGMNHGNATSINDSGTIVGSGTPGPNGGGIGLVWSASGSAQKIGDLGGGFSELVGINNSGVAVGDSGNAQHQDRQITWTQQTGMTDITASLQPNSQVAGIGDSGTIVGTFANGSYAEAFAYSTTTGFQALGLFSGSSSVPKAVNGQGSVAGMAYGANQTAAGFIWSPAGGGEGLGTGPSSMRGSTGATGINSAGTVVGGGYQAYSWTPSVGFRLLTPITSGVPGGITLTQAMAINNKGQIVAQGSDLNYYLLTPKAK